jgi:hypothetical protein
MKMLAWIQHQCPEGMCKDWERLSFVRVSDEGLVSCHTAIPWDDWK